MSLYYSSGAGIKIINPSTNVITTLVSGLYEGALIIAEDKIIILNSAYYVFSLTGTLLKSGSLNSATGRIFGAIYAAPYVYWGGYTGQSFCRALFNNSTNTFGPVTEINTSTYFGLAYDGTYIIGCIMDQGPVFYNPSDMSVVKSYSLPVWNIVTYGDYIYAYARGASTVDLYKYKNEGALLDSLQFIASYAMPNITYYSGPIIYGGFLYIYRSKFSINPNRSLTYIAELEEFSVCGKEDYYYKYFSAPLCFGADTKVEIMGGPKLITNVVTGDVLSNGSIIKSIISVDVEDYEVVKFSSGKYGLMEDIILTKKHKCVGEDGSVVMASDLDGGKLVKYSGIVYNIVTDDEVIVLCNGMKLLTVAAL